MVSHGDHFYTCDANERDLAVNQDSYHVEGIACYLANQPLVGSIPFPNSVPLIRLYNGTDHFYTADMNEAQNAATNDGYHYETIPGYVYNSVQPNTVPLYRLWNGTDHFYTTSASERDQAVAQDGYSFELIACYVFSDQIEGTNTLWRLWNRPHPISQATKVEYSSMVYDLTKAVVESVVPATIYQKTVQNTSTLTDNSEIDVAIQVTSTAGWQDTVTNQITAGGTITIPLASAGASGGTGTGTGGGPSVSITVSGQYQHAQQISGTASYQQTFTIKETVSVPPQSSVEITGVVNQATITVPYSGQATFYFADNTNFSAMTFGAFTGTNSYDIQVKISPPQGESDNLTATFLVEVSGTGLTPEILTAIHRRILKAADPTNGEPALDARITGVWNTYTRSIVNDLDTPILVIDGENTGYKVKIDGHGSFTPKDGWAVLPWCNSIEEVQSKAFRVYIGANENDAVSLWIYQDYASSLVRFGWPGNVYLGGQPEGDGITPWHKVDLIIDPQQPGAESPTVVVTGYKPRGPIGGFH